MAVVLIAAGRPPEVSSGKSGIISWSYTIFHVRLRCAKKQTHLPMIDFTIQELLDFTKMEEETVKEIDPVMESNQQNPSERSVNNLLAYSKALSIRKSRSIRNIAVVLN
jgi:hypothetical protein